MQKYLILLVIFFLPFSQIVNAQQIIWKETTIPMSEAGSQGLEALFVWPDTPGKHPLALISHGSPRDAKHRREMTAISYLPIAMEFARRGFATAVVLRRGYGNSGGDWAESYGSCSDTHYKQAGLASSKDLHTAIDYLSTQPQFDTDRIFAVGVSAGGFATVALTADNPPEGLVAAISFAGGRGSTTADTVCQEDKLVSAFGFYGKTSRVPMLWIYAENDHFFNPDLAKKFLNAFNENGGDATLFVAPSYGSDGHMLFSNKGIDEWTPIVDKFLKKQELILLDQMLPIPSKEELSPPSQLSENGIKQFSAYLASSPHKAFAISDDGSFGWRSGRHTAEEAQDAALETCNQHAKSDCVLYAVDDQLVKNHN